MRVSDFVQEGLVRDGEFAVFDYCTTSRTEAFFGFIEDQKYLQEVSTYLTCVVCKKENLKVLPSWIHGIYVCDHPKEAWMKCYNQYAVQYNAKRNMTDTQIGEHCQISPLAYIASKNVVIGDDVVIEPFAVIHQNVRIGDGCVIHSHAVIGGDGFNQLRSSSGTVIKQIQAGAVELENGVEVYSYVHVAAGVLPQEVTRIGADSRLDAFVYVGHGTTMGQCVLSAGGAVIGGNVVIGDGVWIGLNAAISNRIHIGSQARISLGAVVTKHVESGECVSGNFAIEHKRFLDNLKKSLV